MNRAIGLVALLWALTTLPAGAGIVEGVNEIRSRGCDGKPGSTRPLRATSALDEVAREWSRGGSLQDALARAGGRFVHSSSMRIEGAPSESAILQTLEASYCAVILDASYSEIGVYRRAGNIWIVVAQPFVVPGPADAADVNAQVLRLVNDARSQARSCGNRQYRAVPPLKLSLKLERAALAHARDMAQHDVLEHRGADGSRPADRVSRTGYRWRAVGENIAAGPRDAESVVRGWLDSPGHCANIMGPQFSEMGIAYFADRRSKAGIYWAQVFAAPR